jgi:hypothetical protein
MTADELQTVQRHLAAFGDLERATQRAHSWRLKHLYFVLWVMRELVSREEGTA